MLRDIERQLAVQRVVADFLPEPGGDGIPLRCLMTVPAHASGNGVGCLGTEVETGKITREQVADKGRTEVRPVVERLVYPVIFPVEIRAGNVFDESAGRGKQLQFLGYGFHVVESDAPYQVHGQPYDGFIQGIVGPFPIAGQGTHGMLAHAPVDISGNAPLLILRIVAVVLVDLVIKAVRGFRHFPGRHREGICG